MTFEFKPAVRENVHLLIGLAAASGGGKTKSALELATGLASDPNKIAFVDTEARRGLHYANGPDENSPDKYRFNHVDMLPPFHPDRIIEAVRAAEAAGMEVLIIDSMSHEYDGEGGIMTMADELESGTPKPGIENPRSPKDGDGWKDWAVKPVPSPGNWKEPKAAHKKMMNALLVARCHIIFCLRAEEKIRILKSGDKMANGQVARGTVVESAGWVPICEKRFMFEMTLSLTLRPDNPGRPDYALPHKIQDQHRSLFPEGQFITRDAGKALAKWANGGKPNSAPADAIATYGIELRDLIKKSPGDVLAWWKETETRRAELRIPDDRLSAMAAAVTKAQSKPKEKSE